MRRQFILSALVGIGVAAMFATSSIAGEWGTGCGCGGGYGSVTYAQPTYSYAQPTYTIVPHYVMQPNYVIQRTYIVPQTYYQEEQTSYLPGVAPSSYTEDYPSEGNAPGYRRYPYYRSFQGRVFHNHYVNRRYVNRRYVDVRGPRVVRPLPHRPHHY